MCRQILCSSGCDYRGFVAGRAHEVAIRIARFAIAVLCRCAPYEIASALSIFSGSKPMTVSLPIRVTGVVKAPELVQSRNILSDITIAEFYALLRKILFRVLAEHSAGLRKNDYWGAHIC
jgi:hypothetical protein